MSGRQRPPGHGWRRLPARAQTSEGRLGSQGETRRTGPQECHLPSKFVSGQDLWTVVKRVLQHGTRRRVAVAYLGADAADLLKALQRGDLLVCNASEQALRSGATSPNALNELLERGVRLRSHPRLHAKVYATTTRAFIGSANASLTSTRNEEAGVVVDGSALVSEARALVESLATSSEATLVNADFIKWARTVYKPPRGGATAARRAAAITIVDYKPGRVPKSVSQAAESDRGDLSNDRAAVVDYSWGEPGAWREQQVAVWVVRGGRSPDTWWAHPPAECIATRPVPGHADQVVYWWRTPHAPDIAWSDLRQAVLVRTGRELTSGSATKAARTVDAIYGAFGLLAPMPS